jgi:GTP-binding protein
MASVLRFLRPYKGEIVRRHTGSLVALRPASPVTYGLGGTGARLALYRRRASRSTPAWSSAQCNRKRGHHVNVCKKKQLTNMRAAGSDDALRLARPSR